MEAATAPHLLQCGGFGRGRVVAGLVSPLPRRSTHQHQRRLRRVLAVATEPRPPPSRPAPRTGRTRANTIQSTVSPLRSGFLINYSTSDDDTR